MTTVRADLATMPRRLRLLVGAVITAGVLAVVTGVVLSDDPPVLTAFAAVVGLAAIAQTMGIGMRIGSERVLLVWGDAVLVLALWLLPPGYLAAAVALGVLIGKLAGRRPLVKVAYNTAALAVASAGAVGAVTALGGVAHTSPLRPESVAVLCVGAAVYTVVSAILTAVVVAFAQGSPVLQVAVQGSGVKILMLIGNVAAGLTVVALGIADARWLVGVPPLLWLLHEVYQARVRTDDERRTWQDLANATHRLNRLDEQTLVEAAVRGALRLFSPDAVELVVANGSAPTGNASTTREYVGLPDGGVTEKTGPGAVLPGGNTECRPLVVGDERVGELRLLFRRPVPLGERSHLALSAYADALAVALQNAAAHGQLRTMAERKAFEAEHDELTALVNRSRLLECGDQSLRTLADSGRAADVALLLLDLDHFKDVNDTLGHAAGDELLRAEAARLERATAPGELLARLGGDEFALLITTVPESAPAVDRAVSRARELAAELAQPIEVAGIVLSIEVSIGVVVATAGSCDMTELLRRADVAMYQVKRAGGTVAVYDPGKDATSTDRLALLAELREALDAGDQLVLAMQPAVDLVTGGPTGVEALVRWQHPRRGLLQPGEFIAVVEQSELVGPFTRYVLNEALSVTAGWAAEGLNVPVAVNLSARSLLDRRLPGDIAELLGRHRVPPERLVLEITETVMMTELDIIDDVLAALRRLGVQLAVDDFGTGYSSLTFLARFPVDEVKVDQGFVTRMADSPEAAAIVRTTVELARALDLRVVAEGVETAEQRETLTAIGCTAGQGFHFFPPMPVERTGKVLWTLRRAAEARGAQVIPLTGRATPSRRPEPGR